MWSIRTIVFIKNDMFFRNNFSSGTICTCWVSKIRWKNAGHKSTTVFWGRSNSGQFVSDAGHTNQLPRRKNDTLHI